MYKVIAKFKDIHTKEIFEVGSEYKSKDKKRLEELTQKGFLKFVEPPKPKPKKK